MSPEITFSNAIYQKTEKIRCQGNDLCKKGCYWNPGVHLVPSRREEKFRKEGEGSDTVDKVNTDYPSDFGHVVERNYQQREQTIPLHRYTACQVVRFTCMLWNLKILPSQIPQHMRIHSMKWMCQQWKKTVLIETRSSNYSKAKFCTLFSHLHIFE